jgi:hypothetical protein
MRVVVAGLGVQGHKRRRIAGDDFVAAVDAVKMDARFRSIAVVPLADYDAVLAASPTSPRSSFAATASRARTCWWKSHCGRSTSEIAGLEALAREGSGLLHRL